jgi:BASS family bile acid:Na+ symporter
MKRLERLTNAFPWSVLGAAIVSFIYPPFFTWFKGPWITIGLGIIMLGMGLTLTVEDFVRVLKFPKWILGGVVLQFTIMPLLGWSIGLFFKLPTELAVGLVLVACCPGGTASNVVTYLARANVCLSVTMTAISTMLAIVLTPFLTYFLVGNRVDVNAWGLLLSTFQVVILPVTLGVLANRFLPKLTQKVLPASPLVAVIFITLIVASVVGAGKEQIIEAGASLMLSVAMLHVLGFFLGYFISVFLFKKEEIARTISIEVGMQNSGLGVVLARANFVILNQCRFAKQRCIRVSYT